MLRDVIAPGKSLFADVTGIGPLPGVPSHVAFELIGAAESPLASLGIACVGLLACVRDRDKEMLVSAWAGCGRGLERNGKS